MKLIDMTGQRYGRFTVLSRAPDAPSGDRRWHVQCDCGSPPTIAFGANLRRGLSKSCGCGHAKKHGMSQSRLYRVWLSMRARCDNPKSTSFHNYGGRGIRVCEGWRDFAAFVRDMGVPAPGLTLERRDNDGPYSKANCVWAPRVVQNLNKRNNRLVEFNGERMTATEWARKLGLRGNVVLARLGYGWPIEKVLSPTRYKRNGLPR